MTITKNDSTLHNVIWLGINTYLQYLTYSDFNIWYNKPGHSCGRIHFPPIFDRIYPALHIQPLGSHIAIQGWLLVSGRSQVDGQDVGHSNTIALGSPLHLGAVTKTLINIENMYLNLFVTLAGSWYNVQKITISERLIAVYYVWSYNCYYQIEYKHRGRVRVDTQAKDRHRYRITTLCFFLSQTQSIKGHLNYLK